MKNRWKTALLFFVYLVALIFLVRFLYIVCDWGCFVPSKEKLIISLNQYNDQYMTASEQLLHRIRTQPFNLIATILFCCAIFHTFFAHHFSVLSKRMREKNIRLGQDPVDSFGVEVLRFLGEIEVIFGIWIIPLLGALTYFYSWESAVQYLEGIEFVEPIFVVVIMTLASTGPIVKLAEDGLRIVARLGRSSSRVWWWAILTIGPLSGSLITEPGAMTVSALLLARHFYQLKPRPIFAYATLGLLFTNVSVGGVFTNFAAPPVLMVVKRWGWDGIYMLRNFGWKALLGIVIANTVYYLIFRSEFKVLEERRKARREHEEERNRKEKNVPFWVSLAHVGFLLWTVTHSHHPVVFVGGFLLFLGFYQATRSYQKTISVQSPILVGFFLAGLMVHGTLQAWWIAPILGNASEEMIMVLSTFLTSFNDNAEITFLATLIPNFDEAMRYAIVAGAVTGGGLTVIANAPNPSGQSILKEYFYEGISALGLLSAAIFPTIVMGLCFYLLRGI